MGIAPRLNTGCLGLQSHEVTDACFVQAPAVVDYQHVARCCRFECLQEGIDAAGMPGGTDTTGQAAARHHSMQERRSAAHWEAGAYTGVRQVGCGEGCEPLLQHLVVHDDDSSPWVVAGLMMDWPGLPAGSSAGIGHIDGLRRRALRLQERVGYPVAESQQAGSGQCYRQGAAPPDGVG